MHTRLLTSCLLFTIFLSASAQRGYFYHTDFSPIANLRDQYQYDMEQDHLGSLFFANQNGLMTFDGVNWDMISTPGPIFSMTYFDSVLYVVGTNGLGTVTYDVFGNLIYTNLPDTLVSESSLSGLVAFDSLLYFMGERNLYAYQTKSGEFSRVTLPDRPIALIAVGEKKIVQTLSGCYSLEGARITDKSLNRSDLWLFSSPEPDGSRQLLGNDNNALFLHQNGQIRPLTLNDDGYLNEAILVDAKWLSSDLIAIATIKGGVVFANPNTGKIAQIINYHTGLPDNEVQVMYRDLDGALWVAHPHGFTRVDPQIPFRSFNYYPGLEGIIYTSHVKGGNVFVGTNLGLFYLNEVKSYDEVTYYVKRRSDRPEGEPSFFSSIFQKRTATTSTKDASPTEKKKTGFLGIGKKKETASTTQIAAKTPQRSGLKYQKQTRKELQSITYLYKPVTGIEGRVSQLIDLDKNRMLAAGLDGVFIIENRQAKPIYPDAVKYAFHSAGSKLLLISTYSGSLVSMLNVGGKWEQISLLENMDDFVSYIFEDSKGRIWLCTTKNLYWVKTDGRKILDGGEIPILNNFLDPVMGAEDDSLGLVFVHARGFFQLAGDSLSSISLFGMQTPKRYLASKEQVLISDGRSWNLLGSKAANQSFDFLRVFDQIASLDVEDDGTLWVVTGANEFFKIAPKGSEPLQFDPLIRQIKSANNHQLPIRKGLEVDQREGFLSFHFHQPEYSGFMKMDYRYRLIGVNDSWSEWSPNYRDIEFAFLPPGRYQLEVQTRNIFGSEKSLEPLYFQVVPPYWKRPWFYALEFLFFGALLFFSARLSKTKHLKWQVVNRALAFITIIMVIEFLQTGVQSYFNTSNTPVIDFFVQVCIAFSLLPIEGFMRSRFFEEENKELAGIVSGVSKIKDVIKKKTNPNLG